MCPGFYLRVGTACSGTDSPCQALRHILPERQIEHMFSCDCCQPCEVFIKGNFRPKHFFTYVEDLVKKTTHCSVCNRQCSAHTMELDLFIGGFPCVAFSPLN
eukprot:3262099-Alexandrium_andersonii.AAC.1